MNYSCGKAYFTEHAVAVKEQKMYQGIYGKDKVLKAQIFEIDGKEERVDVKVKEKSKRDRYRDTDIDVKKEPLSDKEFIQYIENMKDRMPAGTQSLIDAGIFLKSISDMPQKNTLKGIVADYILDEMVIEYVAGNENDTFAQKVYAYYKKMMDQLVQNRDENDKESTDSQSWYSDDSQ